MGPGGGHVCGQEAGLGVGVGTRLGQRPALEGLGRGDRRRPGEGCEWQPDLPPPLTAKQIMTGITGRIDN